jgi:hypothetical protein
LANSVQFTPRSRHYCVKLHHFKSYVKSGELVIRKVDTKENVADIFTKALPRPTYEYLRMKLMGW